MRWLSESPEALVASEQPDKVHGAVVVGSGYGGAVAALRLAEARCEVLVLERGEEYLPGDFPNDIANLPAHLRLERWNGSGTQGEETGLFDLRIGESVGVLVGNALGGTSQINANVAIRPDPRVYGQPAWPAALTEGELDRHFATALKTLGVARFDGVYDEATGCHAQVAKHAALEDLAGILSQAASQSKPGLERCSVRFAAADITVNLADPGPKNTNGVPTRPCVGCGDCCSGCNRFAKNTLTTSYLAKAKARGARLFTGVTVLHVARKEDAAGVLWEIAFARTAERGRLRASSEPPEGLIKVLRARTVILSAGSLGSTEILSRSASVNGLPLSAKLGSRFSGNGDYLAFGYLQNRAVDGVGRGSRERAPGGRPVGPTITGMIEIKDADLARCTLIEEGSVPGAIARIFHEMVTTMASVSQLTSGTYRGESEDPPADTLVARPEALTHTQTLLAMGHDSAGGLLCYDEDEDRLRIEWPGLEKEPVYPLHDQRLRHAQEQGAIFLQNPAWRPLPDSVRDALSGPSLGNGMFTVHPLGGCPMGANVDTGVVDDVGAVFDGAGGTHRGLHVLDGAIVPCALGVNPLLTITALAERAMERIVPKLSATAPAAEPGLPDFPPDRLRARPYANPHGDRLALEFTEVLRGPVWYRSSARDDYERRDASLIVHLPVADLERFFEDPSHAIEITGPRGSDVEQLAARLEVSGPPGSGDAEEFLVVSGALRLFETLEPARPRWLAMLRVALTWFIERGHDELFRALERFLGMVLPAPSESKVSPLTLLLDWLKLVRHASEARTFAYDLKLWKDDRTYRLTGSKLFEYAAPWSALWRYVLDWLSSPPGACPYLQRTSVWTSLGLLQIELRDEHDAPLARGALTMDLIDMSRRHAAQLGVKRDTATALIAFAGYPMMFLRAMIKTRLWDFQLPDYPEYVPMELSPRGKRVPVPGPRALPSTFWPEFPSLRAGAGRDPIAPRAAAELRVRRSRHDGAEVASRLTRYAQGRLESAKTAEGAVQVKAIIMINGFAQSTLPFVATEIPQNLAEHFYGQGYDVWLLDYRTSTILDSSREPCTMDDVAENDIPAAVEHIVGVLASEIGADAAKLQIYAFAHCVGSACMAMSMLGGHLRRPDRGARIAGVILSQMQPFLVGGATAQMRIPVGSLLRDVAGVDVVRLSAAEGQATAFESLLDRLLATLPTPDEERCPHENDRTVDRPDIVTCKRAGGVISRLFNHGRMSESTHRKLDVYFGRANTTLLIHGTKCLDYEHLVNADGQNVYVTDANFRRYFRVPIALLHGKDNQLFDLESCARTYSELERINGRDFARSHYTQIHIDGYAHFDCIVGADAHKDVYPALGEFLASAWVRNLSPEDARPGPDRRADRAVAPVTGPILGWVRREGGRAKARLWIQVNEYESDPAWCAMTVSRRTGKEDRVETWPVVRIPLEGSASGTGVAPEVGHVAVSVADLDFSLDEDGAFEVDMVSVHSVPDGESAHTPALDSAGDWIGRVQETLERQAQERPVGQISIEQANAMLDALELSVKNTRNTALSPNPGTLSRKRRDLPLSGTWRARVKPATLGAPAAGSLRFLAGCCRYPGMPFEAERADATFRHINALLEHEARPDFLFMLGDQIYADATAGVYDPRSPVEKFRTRYEQAFSSREFRRLARQLPLYMVIDDHEIDNDWSRDELAKGPDAGRLFLTAISSFAAYQWAHSPRNLKASGFNYEFEAGGYRFLVLDTRTQRRRGSRPVILAEDQVGALEAWLAEGGRDGTPSFIVTGSVLAPGLRNADPRLSDPTVDTWQMAQEQRRAILDLVRRSGARNVVFLSGDYHCAATAVLDFSASMKAYAVVSPPFYAPYVYANVQAHEVIEAETIPLENGEVSVNASPSEGSGFSDINIEALSGQKWSLRVDTWELRLEEEAPRFTRSSRQFLLT